MKRLLKLVRLRDLKTGYFVDCRGIGKPEFGVVIEAPLYSSEVLVRFVYRLQGHQRSTRDMWLTATPDSYIPVIKRDSEGRLINDQI